MSDPNERDSKLVQYMNEAYGKERELEAALQVDIEITTKPAYKKRLKQHLKETKAHARELERRIKKLGGGKSALQDIVGKATAVAKAPGHLLRGSGDQEKMLKNAKTQYFNEHEEISTYLALETFATKVGDSETAKLARGIRKEEERMAKFLEGQIKQLSGAVAQEIPRSQRAGSKKRKAAKRAAPKPAARSVTKKAAAKKPAKAAKKSAAKKAPAKKAAAKKTTAKKAAKKAKAKGKAGTRR